MSFRKMFLKQIMLFSIVACSVKPMEFVYEQECDSHPKLVLDIFNHLIQASKADNKNDQDKALREARSAIVKLPEVECKGFKSDANALYKKINDLNDGGYTDEQLKLERRKIRNDIKANMVYKRVEEECELQEVQVYEKNPISLKNLLCCLACIITGKGVFNP